MYSNLYSFVRRNGWPGGREIQRNLNNLERTQWLPPHELEIYQLKKIQRLVSYAYEHVPFYKKRYQKEDIHPQDIKDLKDFHALPLLTKDDVSNNLDALRSKVYSGKTFENATGGSTGKPLQFIMDRATTKWSAGAELRGRSWYGVQQGDKAAWISAAVSKGYPYTKWSDRLVADIKRQRALNSRYLNEEKLKEFAEMLIKWRPAMLRGYPSALSIFARYLKEQGINSIRPKLIEVISEKITPFQRQLLEETFGAPVADNYTSWEVYNIAYQCPQGGLHVCGDRILELASNDHYLKPGHMAEVVVTSLNQYAMPFIRYKNGDVGIYQSENCTCGRSMPVLEEIVGRADDLLSDTDGKVVHWSIFQPIMRFEREIYQYQLYQPDRNHIKVRLVCKQKVNSAFLEDIRRKLQPCFGDSMKISVDLVDKIELTKGGKQRSIISDVKPNFIH